MEKWFIFEKKNRRKKNNIQIHTEEFCSGQISWMWIPAQCFLATSLGTSCLPPSERLILVSQTIMENGSESLWRLPPNTDTNETLRPFHYDERIKTGGTLTRHIYLLAAGSFGHLRFPQTRHRLRACLSYQPLDRSLVPLPPSDWGITYSDEGGGTEPPPTVCACERKIWGHPSEGGARRERESCRRPEEARSAAKPHTIQCQLLSAFVRYFNHKFTKQTRAQHWCLAHSPHYSYNKTI